MMCSDVDQSWICGRQIFLEFADCASFTLFHCHRHILGNTNVSDNCTKKVRCCRRPSVLCSRTLAAGPSYLLYLWHNPSGRIMALGLTQSLTEMSTRNISWGVKAAGAEGWQPYHLPVPNVSKSGSLSLLEPSGPVQTCNGIAFIVIICRVSVL